MQGLSERYLIPFSRFLLEYNAAVDREEHVPVEDDDQERPMQANRSPESRVPAENQENYEVVKIKEHVDIEKPGKDEGILSYLKERIFHEEFVLKDYPHLLLNFWRDLPDWLFFSHLKGRKLYLQQIFGYLLM